MMGSGKEIKVCLILYSCIDGSIDTEGLVYFQAVCAFCNDAAGEGSQFGLQISLRDSNLQIPCARARATHACRDVEGQY